MPSTDAFSEVAGQHLRPQFMAWTSRRESGGRPGAEVGPIEAKEFYHSPAWKSCRAAYMAKVGGLCERCLKAGRIVPAEIVHHRTYLTPENITNPRISLSFSNLEALCWSCHETEHKGKAKRYAVDAEGRVTALE